MIMNRALSERALREWTTGETAKKLLNVTTLKAEKSFRIFGRDLRATVSQHFFAN